MEQCYRTNKTLVNPIIDWEDEDVWEFIRAENIPYCGLYDEGINRIGCVGCPLGGHAAQRWEFERWPGYKKQYIHAFDEMLKAREARGMANNCHWTDGESVWRWWVGLTRMDMDANQMRWEDYDI